MGTKIRKRLEKLTGLVLFTALGCSGSSEASPEASTQEKKPVAPIEDLAGALRDLRDNVNALTASYQDRSSAEDPESLRGRVRDQEKELSDRASGLRKALKDLFGDEASEESATSGTVQEQTRRSQLMKEIDQTEEKLEKLREQLEKDG